MTRPAIGPALAAALLLAAVPALAAITSPLPPPRPDEATTLAPPPPRPDTIPEAAAIDPETDPVIDPDHDAVPVGDPLRAPLPERPVTFGTAPATAPRPPARAAALRDLAPPAPEPATGRVAMMATPEIVPGIPAPGAPLAPAGTFCRDPRLVGHVMPTFANAGSGCGILEPVEISAAAGITFSAGAQLDCTTARAVADWIMGVVQPAARDILGTRVTGLRVAGSYVCRTRNHIPGARLSEHARGRAIDISAFTTADGQRIDVQSGWRSGRSREFLRRVWQGACGAFGTVLGPDADRHHHDHLHLDTARYRTGAYCR